MQMIWNLVLACSQVGMLYLLKQKEIQLLFKVLRCKLFLQYENIQSQRLHKITYNGITRTRSSWAITKKEFISQFIHQYKLTLQFSHLTTK